MLKNLSQNEPNFWNIGVFKLIFFCFNASTINFDHRISRLLYFLLVKTKKQKTNLHHSSPEGEIQFTVAQLNRKIFKPEKNI